MARTDAVRTLRVDKAGPLAAPRSPSAGRAWLSAVLYVAAAALLLRFYDLPRKPLHHDEGVNTLLLSPLLQPPHTYRYHPANYHGPTLFYFAWGSTLVLGVTTVAIRAVTAAAGLATVLLVLGTRHRIGAAGAIAAASLLTLSPGAVYYSRYFIHEALLACSTLGAVVAASMWARGGRRVHLLLAALSAGLMFATKETAIISAVVLAAALVGARWLVDARQARGRILAEPLRMIRDARARLGGARVTRRTLVAAVQAVFVLLLVTVTFYTSFFANWQGALDALRTFAFWTRTGTTDHPHPWFTYVKWLTIQEGPMLVPGIAGIALALRRSDNRFAVFASLWFLGTLAAYSVIPYKTPWLALNMIVPLALVAGYAAELAWQRRAAVPKWVTGPAIGALLAAAAYQTIVLNFAHYDDERYPYVYAHTDREVLTLVAEVSRLRAANPSMTIAVTSGAHFPLSWYLRDQQAGYYGRPTLTGDPLVIASEDQQPIIEALAGDRFVKLGTYRLRPGLRLVLYARRDLRAINHPGAEAPAP